MTAEFLCVSLRLCLQGNDPEEQKRKSGIALLLFILRLDKRLGWEIRVHMVMQKCVIFNVVCTPDG